MGEDVEERSGFNEVGQSEVGVNGHGVRCVSAVLVCVLKRSVHLIGRASRKKRFDSHDLTRN